MPIIIIRGNKARRITTGNQYDGETIPNDLSEWDTLSTDPNYILESTYGELQKRSKTLYHTYPFVRGAINKQVDYAIGPGLVFRSQPDWTVLSRFYDWANKDWAKDWGKDFQKIVHFYFQEFSFYEKQAVLMRGTLADGDSCLAFERKGAGGRLSDLVDFGGDQIDWEKQTDPYYLGIKHDNLYRREGIYTTEGEQILFQDKNGIQLVVQFLFKELPRQLRGYPFAYTVINLAKQDSRHQDSTVQRANMESMIMASAKLDQTDLVKQFDNIERKSKENKTGAAITTALQHVFGSRKIAPGSIVQLRTGEDYNFNDLKTPSGNYDAFKTWIVKYIGAATGTPPEVVVSCYSTSYTAHKGALNDFEKSYTSKRRTLERVVMYPVIREIAREAILDGLIEAPGFLSGNPMIQRAYLQGMTLGPVPGTINPLQEVNARIAAINAALDLRSNGAAYFGNEWDNFIEEWGSEQAEYDRLSPEKKAERIQKQEEKNAEAGDDGAGDKALPGESDGDAGEQNGGKDND